MAEEQRTEVGLRIQADMPPIHVREAQKRDLRLGQTRSGLGSLVASGRGLIYGKRPNVMHSNLKY